jgi:3-methyladenine DNA glycosylase AlkD
VLVEQYAKGDAAARKERFAFYVAHLPRVNNWDLVDASAAPIVGAHLLVSGDARALLRLVKSKSLWERRVAIVATYAFIKAGPSQTTFEIAELLLNDEHDLLHKAVGWMLRAWPNARDGRRAPKVASSAGMPAGGRRFPSRCATPQARPLEVAPSAVSLRCSSSPPSS